MLKKIYIAIILCIIGGIIVCIALKATGTKPIKKDYTKTTYLPIYKLWHAEEVPGDLLTEVNIAFATIKPDFNIELKLVEGLDLKQEIQKLRESYPKLKINLSIGGWGADGFSDLALTKDTRQIFIESVISQIELYDLDGVDIDWEYPAQDTQGLTKSRKEDTKNFVCLMREIRSRLDALQNEKDKTYTLSFAAPFSSWAIKDLAIKQVSKSVDYIYLMGYDYIGEWSTVTGHHSNLDDNKEASIHLNTDEGLKQYLKVCPPEKLVLGVPAYGYGWSGVASTNNGLFQKATASIPSSQVDLSYNNLKQNYIAKNGFTMYWDDVSKAAYLYNGDNWITYEDSRAISYKAELVKKLGLGGMMYWEHTQDTTGDIITAISNELNEHK